MTENGETRPRRRRRSGKSAKEAFRQRKRMKELGRLLIAAIIGAAIVTAIAVYSGSASN